MELQLTADTEAVLGVGRLKVLAKSRVGRPRSQAVKIVWHDSPDRTLLTECQALSEERGAWRLERLKPGTETWLPAQPPPVVSEAPDPALLPPLLAPLAAFEGRRTSSVHQLGADSITVIVEKGILRTVTAEHPVARIFLSGEEAAVRTVALQIADAISIAVPLASLAAQGIALATGQVPLPRHDGAPVLPETPASVPEAFAHILGHLADVILANAPAAANTDDTGTEAVHQMRVAVRRARSALSIFRPALPAGILNPLNDLLKTLGAKLGPSRDWDVFADETAPALQHALPDDERLQRLVAAASRRRRECRTVLATYLASTEFRMLGIELAWFAAARSWHMPPVDVEAVLPSLTQFAASVLQHRWKKLLSAGKQMDELDIAGLHAVRLRAKRARYAAEMFATLHRGRAAQRFIRRLSRLQQHLGVLNDGAVATHLLEELGGASGRHGYSAGIVAGFMAARAEMIRPKIMAAFDKFRHQPVYWT